MEKIQSVVLHLRLRIIELTNFSRDRKYVFRRLPIGVIQYMKYCKIDERIYCEIAITEAVRLN